MPRRLAPALASFVALGLVVESRGVEAEPSVEPVHVIYDAGAGCPDRSSFVEQILARTRKATMAGPNDARRTFAVTIRAREDGTFAGRLEIRATTEATTDREVTGPACAAVTTALALVTALAIDPDSMHAETLPTEGPPRSPPQAPPIAEAPSRAVASESASVWRWRIGAQGEGSSAMAPTAAVGGSIFAELASDEIGDGSARVSVGLSSLRLGLHYAGTGTIQRAGAAARFDWAALGLEGCPVRLRFGRRADLFACARFDAGALRAQGDEIAVPEVPIRPWWGVAPLVRFQWFAASSWFVGAEAALVVPLRRDTFVFEDPTRTFHQVPALGAGAGIGLGYQFGDRDRGLWP